MHDPVFDRKTYHYDLNQDLVAQWPHEQRDHSRLLISHPDNQITHHMFYELTQVLDKPCLFVVNDSRVFPSRIIGQLADTKLPIELFLLEPLDDYRWQCLAKPLRKIRTPGTLINCGQGLYGTTQGCTPYIHSIDTVTVKFNYAKHNLEQWLDEHGIVPLPPYIRRSQPEVASQSKDRLLYQTIYARERGSVAAPTAGLHFTDDLMTQLKKQGHQFCTITLHVGAGTFMPVKTQDIRLHSMHQEKFYVESEQLTMILKAQSQNRPIIAVGTTTLRCLEALNDIAKDKGVPLTQLTNQWLSTRLFIYPTDLECPSYHPWACSALLTNFHQPESSLFMLVCALKGVHYMKKLYTEAQSKCYRFFSYGDASLLWFKS